MKKLLLSVLLIMGLTFQKQEAFNYKIAAGVTATAIAGAIAVAINNKCATGDVKINFIRTLLQVLPQLNEQQKQQLTAQVKKEIPDFATTPDADILNETYLANMLTKLSSPQHKLNMMRSIFGWIAFIAIVYAGYEWYQSLPQQPPQTLKQLENELSAAEAECKEKTNKVKALEAEIAERELELKNSLKYMEYYVEKNYPGNLKALPYTPKNSKKPVFYFAIAAAVLLIGAYMDKKYAEGKGIINELNLLLNVWPQLTEQQKQQITAKFKNIPGLIETQNDILTKADLEAMLTKLSTSQRNLNIAKTICGGVVLLALTYAGYQVYKIATEKQTTIVIHQKEQ